MIRLHSDGLNMMILLTHKLNNGGRFLNIPQLISRVITSGTPLLPGCQRYFITLTTHKERHQHRHATQILGILGFLAPALQTSLLQQGDPGEEADLESCEGRTQHGEESPVGLEVGRCSDEDTKP